MYDRLRNVDDQERINWIRLIRSENVGPVSFHNLLEVHGNVENALDALPSMSLRGGRTKPVKVASVSQCEKELDVTRQMGGTIITACEPEFPILLKQLRDFPPIITVYGNDQILNHHSVAIVGSRNASANGCRFSEKLAHDIGQHHLMVISGLARGVDTAAHRGALKSGTIAVMAGGLNHIYPPENKELFRSIGENGAVITEMPYDAVPKAQNFPRRNRIISGMSLGVVVVEANFRSGSLITSRMALEQSREVFAVPGFPLDPRSVGTNDLIKQGAHLVSSASDVVDVIKPLCHSPQNYLNDSANQDYHVPKVKPLSEKKLNEVRSLVVAKIGASPTAVNDIVSQTGLAPNIILTILLEMELAGKLDRHPGNKVSVVYSQEEDFADVSHF